MKNLPRFIHWCGQDLEVNFVEKLDGGDSWGRTTLTTGTIHIERNMVLPKQWEVLIHELLHLAYRQTAHTQLDDKQEEQIVETWAYNIYAVLKDNELLNIE